MTKIKQEMFQLISNYYLKPKLLKKKLFGPGDGGEGTGIAIGVKGEIG